MIGSEEIGCYTPNALDINYGPDSYGNYVDALTPQVCWHYFDSEPTTQAAFEIQVGTDDDWSVAELWGPGPNYTADSCVTYAGMSLSEGETYYLRIRVNNGTDWGSWSQAWFIVHLPAVLNVPDEYETIQAGINAAIHGDMVKVASGIYSGEGNRDIHFDGKGIHLFAEDGAENTIIDCGGSEAEPHRAFRFSSGEAPDAIVNGFKIINGFGPIERDNSTGGAIYCSDASPTIRNCIFENNIGKSNGGAISAWGSSITIANCTFSNNHAIHGSAIYYKGVPEKNRAITSNITKCLFDHNIGLSEDMSYGGAILLQYAGMTVNLTDCVLYCNEADAGGAVAIWYDAVMNVSGCTIVGNKSNPGIGGAFYAFLNAELNIENSIIAFSKLGEALYCGEDATVNVMCTDIFGNAGGDWTKCLTGLEEGDGNFSANPRFCNVATGDLSLSSNSPCLPANSSCEELIGVYGQGCAGYNYQVWKIKPDGSGDISTIQEAINQAVDGDTILVKGGTYTGDGNRDLDLWCKQIVIISENGALYTIIDCQGTEAEPHRAFRLCNGENAANVIIGLTFMNGYGVFEKDNPKGGALYISNSSPIFEECIFKNNSTPKNGGAVSGWGTDAVFNDCSFSNNTGMHGAAVYLNGVPDIYKGDRVLNPTFNRCSFSENTCTEIFTGEGTSVGGAILMQYANLNVDFNSCIFRGNSADYGSAAVCWDDATLTMTNCTVVGNSSNVSGNGAIVLSTYYTNPRFVLNNSIIAFNVGCKAVHCSDYADITITCSDISGNAEGDFVGCITGYFNVNGNVSEDPQFCNLAVNNIHIDPGSVCAPENNNCGTLMGAMPEGCVLCGDSNGDTKVNVSDAVYILNYYSWAARPRIPLKPQM